MTEPASRRGATDPARRPGGGPVPTTVDAGGRSDLIPVVLNIDLEPDGPGGELEAGGTWHGVTASRRWVGDLRERTEATTGRRARVTWLLRLDPQVEEVFGSASHLLDAFPDLLEEAERNGDEVGLHIHAWRRREGRWVDDFGDAAWLRDCIDRSFAAFAAAVGRPCRVASMGNRYLGPVAIEQLARHRVAIDLTGEPANHPVPDGTWDGVSGDIPDFRRMPRHPHRLPGGIVELPLSAASKRLGRSPRGHLSRMRRHGLRERLDHPLQLGGKDVPGVEFAELLRDPLRHLDRPFLSFAVRSDGLIDPVQAPRLVARTDALFDLPEAPRLWFTTPADAVEAVGVR